MSSFVTSFSAKFSSLMTDTREKSRSYVMNIWQPYVTQNMITQCTEHFYDR